MARPVASLRFIRRIVRNLFDLQFRKKALSFAVWQVLGHRGYRKFIVLTRSRTGSYMLISMLDSHPAIRAKGESLRHLRRRPVEKVLKSVFYRYPRSVKAVGFKMMYFHPFDDHTGRAWEKLREIENLHVVHLKRKNILRAVVSHEIANKTGAWSDRRGQPIPIEQRRLHLAPEQLQREFSYTRQQEGHFERLFAGKPSIEIFYEDLVRDPGREFRRITDWLGVEFHPPRTILSKQNPEKLRDLVVNYEVLKHVFARTEWAPLFED